MHLTITKNSQNLSGNCRDMLSGSRCRCYLFLQSYWSSQKAKKQSQSQPKFTLPRSVCNCLHLVIIYGSWKKATILLKKVMIRNYAYKKKNMDLNTITKYLYFITSHHIWFYSQKIHLCSSNFASNICDRQTISMFF